MPNEQPKDPLARPTSQPENPPTTSSAEASPRRSRGSAERKRLAEELQRITDHIVGNGGRIGGYYNESRVVPLADLQDMIDELRRETTVAEALERGAAETVDAVRRVTLAFQEAQPDCVNCGCPALSHPSYYPFRPEGDPACRQCRACRGYRGARLEDVVDWLAGLADDSIHTTRTRTMAHAAADILDDQWRALVGVFNPPSGQRELSGARTIFNGPSLERAVAWMRQIEAFEGSTAEAKALAAFIRERFELGRDAVLKVIQVRAAAAKAEREEFSVHGEAEMRDLLEWLDGMAHNGPISYSGRMAGRAADVLRLVQRFGIAPAISDDDAADIQREAERATAEIFSRKATQGGGIEALRRLVERELVAMMTSGARIRRELVATRRELDHARQLRRDLANEDPT